MSSLSFKQFAIVAGGTPQPLVGTFLAATPPPSAPNPDGSEVSTFQVGDSSMLLGGEEIFVCSPTFTNAERIRCTKIIDATHIQVKGSSKTRLGGAAGTGDWIALAILVNRVYVQATAGGAGLLYVGNRGLVKAGLVHVVKTLFNVTTGAPSDFDNSLTEGPNASSADDWWIDGTTGDTYLPSYGVV